MDDEEGYRPYGPLVEDFPILPTLREEAVCSVIFARSSLFCQVCFQPVPDDQVEFDHIIPYSKGGASTADNLRLVHRRPGETGAGGTAPVRFYAEQMKDSLWGRGILLI
ncbi:MAG: HNH endonuclease signature motif containing protein [Bacillota bacterium]